MARRSQPRQRLRRVGEAVVEQHLEGQRRVAQPDVPVVPVAHAAELLRQARRRGGDDAAGVLVGERPQHEQRPAHLRRRSTGDVHVRRDPVAATSRWCAVMPADTSGGSRRLPVRRVPGHRDVDGVALVHSEMRHVAVVVRGELRAADDDGVRTGDGDDGAAVLLGTLTDPRERRRIAEPDAQLLHHVHRAADSDDAAHQVGAAVAERHQVGDLDLAGLGHPPGHQHEGVLDIPPAGAHHAVLGSQQPATVVLVAQQRAERGRRVEPGQAQPVDASVPPDHGAGVAVTDECVILYLHRHASLLHPARCAWSGTVAPQACGVTPRAMSEHIGTLVIFGALGDLTKRLLLPGLGQLLDHEKRRRVPTDRRWNARVLRRSSGARKCETPSRRGEHRGRARARSPTRPPMCRRM